MASKIAKQGMAMTYIRSSAEQEPVVVFSCILGGLGEGARFLLSSPHPTPPREPCASGFLPASTTPESSLSTAQPKAPRAQRLSVLCLRAAHSACLQLPVAYPPPLHNARLHPLAPRTPPSLCSGFVMPFFFADGGRSVEEANTSFGCARPPRSRI